MELTRREATAALAAIGAGSGALVYSHDGSDPEGEDLPEEEHVRETMIAVAEVVYPSDVTGIGPFVETFLDGRLDDDAHRHGMREAVASLDQLGQKWHEDTARELDEATRDQLLREVGADTAAEDPGGTTAGRVRYYIVNELLLALYTSPKGAELVGLENPQGHPGGTDTYQRGPQP